jgi:hypothetical protein
MIFARQGRIALATCLKSRPIAVALGRGDVAWGAQPPQPTGNETTLVDPIVLVRPRFVEYVEPAANGPITLADGSTWAMTQTPTTAIYINFKLDYQDIPSETLREMSIIFDPVIAATVPPGQFVVPWVSVTNAGQVYAIERMPPMERQFAQWERGEVIEL